ncbi:MAG: hypothetical protein R3A45_00485 [Bdellovibrionota bacterium]
MQQMFNIGDAAFWGCKFNRNFTRSKCSGASHVGDQFSAIFLDQDFMLFDFKSHFAAPDQGYFESIAHDFADPSRFVFLWAVFTGVFDKNKVK